MYLKNISLVNFKNYNQINIDFSEKINCFIGNNGIGKTNLLDAIYYLSFCKSYFNPNDSQNIKHNEDFFVIQGKFDRFEEEEDIYCGLKRNHKKIFKRNKKEYKRLAEHIGLLPLVMISPYDSQLISGGSEDRRKFIDGVISQYDKEYLNNLVRYNRALAQRNKLLKGFAKNNNFNRDSLELWDEHIIALSQKIYFKRNKFTEDLIPIFQKYYDFITLGNEKVSLKYISQLQDDNFEERFLSAIEKDRILQYTTCGIHKDDLELNIGDMPMKKLGSQGQQKSYLIALKFAQFDFIKNIYNFKPILLLDDIFDKLDFQRAEQIVKLVADNNFRQIFFTDTSQDRLEKILNKLSIQSKIFRIEDYVNGK